MKTYVKIKWLLLLLLLLPGLAGMLRVGTPSARAIEPDSVAGVFNPLEPAGAAILTGAASKAPQDYQIGRYSFTTGLAGQAAGSSYSLGGKLGMLNSSLLTGNGYELSTSEWFASAPPAAQEKIYLPLIIRP